MIKGITITAEEVEKLVIKYRTGDDTCRHNLILAHIETAQITAIPYYIKYRKKYFDILASAYYGLCEAVNRAQEKLTDNNITPYIIVVVRRYIQEYIDGDALIRIPKSAIRKYLKLKDDEIEILFPKWIDSSDVTQKPSTKQNFVDVNNLLEYLKLTELEYKILKLRTKGFTHREIFTKLKITSWKVTTTFWKIRNKAKQFLGE